MLWSEEVAEIVFRIDKMIKERNWLFWKKIGCVRPKQK